MSFQIKEYRLKIKLLSGLHIGGGDTAMHIGGIDKEVIKNPRTQQPYIPGSSLKGKVRSLLEYSTGIQNITNGRVYSLEDYEKHKDIPTILKLFGVSGDDLKKYPDKKCGTTRLSFADSELLNTKKHNVFEVKTETAIDRIKGTAKDKSLRMTERVIAGEEFETVVSMKVFADDNEQEFENMLLKGFKLLSMDALGASGSRGYGRVKIIFNDSDIRAKFEDMKL